MSAERFSYTPSRPRRPLLRGCLILGPSQEIYGEGRKIRGKKVIVASMGALAASGGYYIACGADKIFANPGTITGSIGVLMKFLNVKDLIEKIGVKGVVVKSGSFKDTGSPD